MVLRQAYHEAPNGSWNAMASARPLSIQKQGTASLNCICAGEGQTRKEREAMTAKRKEGLAAFPFFSPKIISTY